MRKFLFCTLSALIRPSVFVIGAPKRFDSSVDSFALLLGSSSSADEAIPKKVLEGAASALPEPSEKAVLVSSTGKTSDSLENSIPELMRGMVVSAFFNPDSRSRVEDAEPIAVGRITGKISPYVFAVTFKEMIGSPTVEMGSRVFVDVSSAMPNFGVTMGSSMTRPLSIVDGTTMGGLVAKVQGDGTFAVLLDDDQMDPNVTRDRIKLSEGKPRFTQNDRYRKVLEWIRRAGVEKKSDCESTARILFQRGWRLEKMYLLEASDDHCLAHLNKSIRMSLLERAEWEREHQRHKREQSKERLKEQEWKYVIHKYASVMSCIIAVCGVCSMFLWNLKNWRKQSRDYQLDVAVAALTRGRQHRTPTLKLLRRRRTAASGQQVVPPTAEEEVVLIRSAEEKIGRVISRLDSNHPRIAVVVGASGCGKSVIVDKGIAASGHYSIVVDVQRGEDVLRSIVRALGVANIDVCGSLVDFIAEACQLASKKLQKERAPSSGNTVEKNMPLLVLKTEGGHDDRKFLAAYTEAIKLAVDRRACHVVLVVDSGTVTPAMVALPRLDFYRVPTFSVEEAKIYCKDRFAEEDLDEFVRVIGTNTNDLDELIMAVSATKVTVSDFISKHVATAMRHLAHVWQDDAMLKKALFLIADQPFETGLSVAGGSQANMPPPTPPHELLYLSRFLRQNPASELKDILQFDAYNETWLFTTKLMHSATNVWKEKESTPNTVDVLGQASM